MQDSFFEMTFQSSLNVGALLFGVFGFLYSVYAMNSNVEIRPPIVKNLKLLCKIIALLIALNFGVSVYSIILMEPFSRSFSLPHTVIAAGFLLIGLTASVISLWMAFEAME